MSKTGNFFDERSSDRGSGNTRFTSVRCGYPSMGSRVIATLGSGRATAQENSCDHPGRVSGDFQIMAGVEGHAMRDAETLNVGVD